MANSDEKIDVRGDGRVVLYKRTHLKRPKWQARISVPNATGYKVVSTKTADLEEAKRFAKNLYEQLYMQVMAGGALNTKSFKQVFEEWKVHATTVGTTRNGGSWASTIHRVKLAKTLIARSPWFQPIGPWSVAPSGEVNHGTGLKP